MAMMRFVFPQACLVFKVHLNSQRRVGALASISQMKRLTIPLKSTRMFLGLCANTDLNFVEQRDATSFCNI